VSRKILTGSAFGGTPALARAIPIHYVTLRPACHHPPACGASAKQLPFRIMAKILITGMSGTGKTTVIEALGRRNFVAVESDDPGWCVPADGDWSGHDSTWVWDETRIGQLLAAPRATHLFISGCRPNQGKFYDRFDYVVLLTAPLDVMLARVTSRMTNPFGSRPEERAAIIRDKHDIEPLLRRRASVIIDTSRCSIDDVVARIMALL
jgi:broad-specificity NMP kinase